MLELLSSTAVRESGWSRRVNDSSWLSLSSGSCCSVMSPSPVKRQIGAFSEKHSRLEHLKSESDRDSLRSQLSTAVELKAHYTNSLINEPKSNESQVSVSSVVVVMLVKCVDADSVDVLMVELHDEFITTAFGVAVEFFVLFVILLVLAVLK